MRRLVMDWIDEPGWRLCAANDDASAVFRCHSEFYRLCLNLIRLCRLAQPTLATGSNRKTNIRSNRTGLFPLYV
jgi:hypothetical protein